MVDQDGTVPDTYQELVQFITEIEKTSSQSTSSTVDISILFERKPEEEKKATYLQMLDMMEGVDYRKQPANMEKRFEQQGQPHIIASGLAQTQFSQMGQPQQFESPMSRTAKSAKAEINDVTRRIGAVNTRGMFIRRVNVSDLVLPSLSIADQIAELERIIEGLREKVFDKDHLDIVIEEVYGLAKSVNKSKKKIKSTKEQLSDLEKSLWKLRDQRVSEAIALIRQQGRAS